MTEQFDELNVIVETKEVEIEVDDPTPDIDVIVDSYPDVIVLPTTGLTGPAGPEGDPGPQGPEGTAGAPGVQTTYVFTQIAVGFVWDIAHDLNRFPSVTVIDTGGSEIIPDVIYESANLVRLYFENPTSGKAYLN
jgi:hypothetical protein